MGSDAGGHPGPRVRGSTVLPPFGRTVTVEQDPSAALLVRVWLEGGESFRARLTAADTSGGADPDGGVTVAVSSSPGEVVDAVRDWLERFVSDALQGD